MANKLDSLTVNGTVSTVDHDASGGKYVEVWRVIGGQIYGTFNVGEKTEASSIDNFAHVGTSNCSRSKSTSSQSGKAFFISETNAYSYLIKKSFENKFNTGKRGIPNAFALPSRKTDAVKYYDEIRRAAKLTLETTKLVEFSWSCCDNCLPLGPQGGKSNNCDRKDTDLEFYLDGKKQP